MIAIIREHNQLTGYRLVVGLYGATVAGISALCGYYVLNGRLLEAAAWFGFEVNCLVILAFAVAALRVGRPDVGVAVLRDPVMRRRHQIHRTTGPLPKRTAGRTLRGMPRRGRR